MGRIVYKYESHPIGSIERLHLISQELMCTRQGRAAARVVKKRLSRMWSWTRKKVESKLDKLKIK